MREFASRSGELPAEEGYPASLPAALAAFYERAGRVHTLAGAEGSVTVIAAVSPPGGDFTEPVSAHTQRFVRTVWTLDRDLAYGRHYPAVTWRSSSRATPMTSPPGMSPTRIPSGPNTERGRRRSSPRRTDSNPSPTWSASARFPVASVSILLTGRLIREAVLQQSALSPNDGYAARPKQSAIAESVLIVQDRCLELISKGVPASLVEEVDFSPLIRARDVAGPADVDTVIKLRDEVLALLPPP